MKLWLFISLLFHLLAAVYSTGFHHVDEHFQVLEFANHKLNQSPAEHLPWEFASRLRPYTQPAIIFGLGKLIKAIGIDSPFFLTFILRLISALLGWLTLVLLAHCCLVWFSTQRLRGWSVATISLLWFLPYQHVRITGENWSGSLFFIGLALLVLTIMSAPKRKKWVILPTGRTLFIGLLWGFCFLFRFQMGIAIFFLGLWCLLFGRVSVGSLVKLLIGVLVAIGIGCLIDHWGYGVWTLTPWNYFKINILQNRASDFGIEPFWQYFTWIFLRGGPPLSLLFIILPLFGFLLFPRHLLTWAVLPFFFIHCLIPHKELRFLFSMAPALAPLMFLGLDGLRTTQITFFHNFGKTLKRFFDRQWVFRLIVLFNGVLLLFASILPGRSEVSLWEWIYKNKLPNIYSEADSPYVYFGLHVNFYQPKEIQIHSWMSSEGLLSAFEVSDKPMWIYIPTTKFPDTFPDVFPVSLEPMRPFCELQFHSLSPLLRAKKLEPLWRTTKLRILAIYRCSRSEVAQLPLPQFP